MANSSFLGSQINLVKSLNLRAVLLTLLNDGSISRVQLANRTSLSSTTITKLVAELLEQGVVIEETTAEQEERLSGEPRAVGRPRTALRLVPDARYAIGIHIGIGFVRVAVANLHAGLVHNQFIRFDISRPAEQVLGAIADLVNEVIAASRVEPERILGIGIGSSGLTDHRQGITVLAPNLGWQQVAVKSYFEARLGLPVIVDNNVRAMALGEAMYGAGKGTEVLAFVYGRVGVGAGFVVNGQIYHGSAAGAGEIGHVTILPQGGETCSCGNRGCLETLVSEPALLRQARLLAEAEPDGSLARVLRQSPDIEAVFAAARLGDSGTRQMLAHRGYYLGIALANLVNVLNPDLILLGGIFAQGADLLLPSAEETMRAMAFARLGENVRLQITGFGWRAGVIGAATLALNKFFFQQPETLL
jgi:glucokinase-like ROK family protein